MRSTLTKLALASAAVVALSASPDAQTTVAMVAPGAPVDGARAAERINFNGRLEGALPARHNPAAIDRTATRTVGYQADDEEADERARMKEARATVRFSTAEPTGTIVVDTEGGHLYRLNGDGTATRYGIDVGRAGFTWSGVERVTHKEEWPDWTPSAEILAREPALPDHLPGGPRNPLGARALHLGDTHYRIHGSPEDEALDITPPGSIVMLNEDVADLYERVKLGTEVIVLGPGSDRTGILSAVSAL